MNIYLTIFGTTVSGVCVFVIKEIIQIYYFDVAKMYRKIKSEVASALILYNDLIFNPVLISNSNENYNIAKMEFKKLSAELISFSEEHPLFIKIKSGFSALEKAVIGLIGLSDNLIISDLNTENAIKCNIEFKNNIIDGLKFKMYILNLLFFITLINIYRSLPRRKQAPVFKEHQGKNVQVPSL